MTARNRLFAVMTASFFLLAIPMAAMGVAWPSAAEDLARAIGDLGFVTFAFGAGYTASTLASGDLNRRFTAGPLLVTAGFAASGGLATIAMTSTWPMFLTAVFLVGLAGGLIDSSVNAYVALRRGARSMGIIHTAFGVGSAVGPLLVTGLVALGASWRVAFGMLAGADLVLALAFLATIGALGAADGRTGSRPSAKGKRVMLALSVAVFVLYAGIAAGTGAWGFSLLTEGRGVATGIAGIALAGYWAAMTASRVLLGIAGDRIDPNRVLTASAVGTALCLLVLWLAPTPWLGIAGLVLSGFAHGSVFPLEMLLTARRFGAAYTPWAVGFQIAGANVGVAIVSGGIGLLVGRYGIEIVAPALFVIAIGLLMTIELLRAVSVSHVTAPANR